MKKLNLTLTALLALGLTFTSCKKDDSPEPTTQQNTEVKKEDPKPEPTVKELLLDKKWQVTAMVFDEPIDLGDGTFLSDVYEYMEECERDDYMVFREDDKGLSSVGDELCDPDEADADFLWYQDPDDENSIWIDTNGETMVGTISKIDDKTMVFDTEANVGGDMLPIKIHFKAV